MELMSGARAQLANTPDIIAIALKSNAPLLIIGEEALKTNLTLLDKIKEKDWH